MVIACASSGSSTGLLNVPGLTRGVDGNWTTSFTAHTPENITVALAIDAKPVAQATITVMSNSNGVNVFFVDYDGSSSEARLVSQGLKAEEPVAAESAMLVYLGENSQLSISVMDLFGRR